MIGPVKVGIMACRERAPLVYKNQWRLKNAGYDVDEVLWDDDRAGAWANGSRFWANLDAEYGILIQDDIILPGAFESNVLGIVNSGMVKTVCSCFWANDLVRRLAEEGKRWIYDTETVWGATILASQSFMEKVLVWEPSWIKPEVKHDDARIVSYMMAHDERAVIAIPSIVDHLEGPSLMGNPIRPFGKKRTAYALAEEVLDWEPTEENLHRGKKRGREAFRSMFLNDRFPWEG